MRDRSGGLYRARVDRDHAFDEDAAISTVRHFLVAVPDEKLLAAPRRWRGRGRDDHPVHVLWGTILLTVLLRHPTIEACLGELQRNVVLRRLIRIDLEGGVPKRWNVSRFLDVLGTEPLRRMTRLHGRRARGLCPSAA